MSLQGGVHVKSVHTSESETKDYKYKQNISWWQFHQNMTTEKKEFQPTECEVLEYNSC